MSWWPHISDADLIVAVGLFVYLGIAAQVHHGFEALNKRIDDIVRKIYDF